MDIYGTLCAVHKAALQRSYPLTGKKGITHVHSSRTTVQCVGGSSRIIAMSCRRTDPGVLCGFRFVEDCVRFRCVIQSNSSVWQFDIPYKFIKGVCFELYERKGLEVVDCGKLGTPDRKGRFFL